jgi:hypothetical protein
MMDMIMVMPLINVHTGSLDMDLKFEVRMITPEYAEALLGTMGNNRPISQPKVRQYANAMARGKWQLNGEAIIVSNTGKLLDGQHRLMAIVEFGKPVQMIICTGAHDDSFETINTGRVRSNGDIVGMAGYNYSNIQAACASLLWKLWFNHTLNEPCPADIVTRVLERYKSINKWAQFVGAKNSPIMPKVPFVMGLVYLDEITQMPGVAEGFYTKMTKGTDMEDGHPVLTLRNRMANLKGTGAQMSIANCWGPVARTLSAIETGEAIYALRIPGSSGQPPRRPDKWTEHVEALPKALSLDDLWIVRPASNISGKAKEDAKKAIVGYKARHAAAVEAAR